MLDWQVTGEGEPFPDEADNAAPRRWRRRVRWRWVLAALFAVALVGAGGVRWRVAERERAMRADLEAFVRHEEQQRAFGLREAVAGLIAREVPAPWLARYAETFGEEGDARPVAVEVETVRWTEGGAGAEVTVRVDGQPQRRAYRLLGQRWRRAALDMAAWGGEVRMRVGAPHLFRYRQGDHRFGQALARDLPALFATLDRWEGEGAAQLDPISIELRPSELDGPLLRGAPMVVANSPRLARVPPGLSGEGAVRFAIAQAVMRDAGATLERHPTLLNGTRLLQAARVVAAMHWALPAEERAALRAVWRERANVTQWKSPLFVFNATRGTLDPWQPTEPQAAALLTMDFVAEAHGADALPTLLAGSLDVASWDRLLVPALGRYARDVDQAVQSYARNGLAEALAEQEPSPPASLAVPLEATQLWRRAGLSSWDAAVVGADQPVHLEAGSALIFAVDGTPLAPDCLALRASFLVEGDWLDVDRTLAARRIILRNPQPPIDPIVVAAPPETMAFGAAFVPENQVDSFGALWALQADGQVVRLGAVGDLTPISPWRGPNEGRYLARRSFGNCNMAWYAIYDAARGTLTPWTSDPAFEDAYPLSAHWLPQSNDVVITSAGPSPGRARSYALLEAEPPYTLTPIGALGPAEEVVGWEERRGRLLLLDRDGGTLHWLDPQSDARELWVEPVPGDILHTQLSADGEHLFFLTRPTTASAWGSELHRFDLATGGDVLLHTLPVDSWASFSFQVAAGDFLLVYTAVVEQGGVGRQQLFSLDPAQSDRIRLVFESNGDEDIGWVTGCSTGDVLYTVGRAARQELRLWHPDGTTQTLAPSEDVAFFRWMCR